MHWRTPKLEKFFSMEEKVENIEKSRVATYDGNQNQYKALLHSTRPLLRKGNERDFKNFVDDVDGHFNANDHRALEKLLYEPLF